MGKAGNGRDMADKTYDVIGIGNAIVDIIARCDEGFLSKHDLAKGSMRLIDADEANRLYAAMGPAVERSGGSVANAIAGLASFGAKCGFIGRVAADQFGGIFRHDIRSLGVAYDTLPADGAPTARCLILVTPDGERTMNTFLGASVDFRPEDLDLALIGAAKIVYLEGYLFDRDEAKAAFREAAREAKAAGAKVALDPVGRLLRRPAPRGFQGPGAGRRRYRVRQREGDHHPLPGEQLRGGGRRRAQGLRDGRSHPLGRGLGDRGGGRDD